MLKPYFSAILWAILVLFLCGINGSSLPQLEIDFAIGIDKIAHILLFGIQAWFLMLAFRKSGKIPALKFAFLAALISSLYGVFIEVLQATVFINRMFDYADMLANAFGAFLTIPLGSLLLVKKI